MKLILPMSPFECCEGVVIGSGTWRDKNCFYQRIAFYKLQLISGKFAFVTYPTRYPNTFLMKQTCVLVPEKTYVLNVTSLEQLQRVVRKALPTVAVHWV